MTVAGGPSAACACLVLIVANNSSLNVNLPVLQRALGSSNSGLQWLVDAYSLVFAGLLLPAGALADRYGRKSALQLGLAVVGLASLTAMVCSTTSEVILCRAVMGAGAAFIMPGTLSILSNIFPPSERGKAIAIWAGFAGFGGLLGPMASGFLLDHFYWGSAFFINVPIILVALVAGFFLVPNSKDPADAVLDPLGVALVVSGLLVLLYGVIDGPERGWMTPPIVSRRCCSAPPSWSCSSCGSSTRPTPCWTCGCSATENHGGVGDHHPAVLRPVRPVLHLCAVPGAGEGVRPAEDGGDAAAHRPVDDGRGADLGADGGTVRPACGGRLRAAVHGHRTRDTGDGQAGNDHLGPDRGRDPAGLGIGQTTAPSTTLIMSAVRTSKSGVGSAVNDVSRELGERSLRMTVLGSVLNQVYRGKIGGRLPPGLPPRVVADAHKSVTDALLDITDPKIHLPAQLVTPLIDAVRTAFADGFGFAMLGGRADARRVLGHGLDVPTPLLTAANDVSHTWANTVSLEEGAR